MFCYCNFFCFFFSTVIAYTVLHTILCTGCSFSDCPTFWIIVTGCCNLCCSCLATVHAYIGLYSRGLTGWLLSDGSFIPDVVFLTIANISDKDRIRTYIIAQITAFKIICLSLLQYLPETEIIIFFLIIKTIIIIRNFIFIRIVQIYFCITICLRIYLPYTRSVRNKFEIYPHALHWNYCKILCVFFQHFCCRKIQCIFVLFIFRSNTKIYFQTVFSSIFNSTKIFL